MDDLPDNLFERTLYLKNMVEVLGTGGGLEEPAYRSIRAELCDDPETRELIPIYIRVCRDSGSLWAHLKDFHEGSGAYAARRKMINDTFSPILEFLEFGRSRTDRLLTIGVQSYDADGVSLAWQKALDRRAADPEGAITASRSLLEEVCKHILEDANVEYQDRWDLPKLYSSVAKELRIAPSQHSEDALKKILGGCQSVVENLGQLRNKVSDAHGGGRKKVRPAPRHAALAVNLAGSMALFLIETWKSRSEQDS
ncbi:MULTISPECIES: abortive infection family protein [unclassified Ruegeria]|uniref:abortive infection family protein n=1 Tax=unclassified Ruegeria TaxID=2625375 RepID=UPI001C2B80F1|nr:MULTISPECIES: abortive infection family protein [unclassified Ruegeria]